MRKMNYEIKNERNTVTESNVDSIKLSVNPPRPNASIMDGASCRMRERNQVSPYSFPHCHFRWHRLSNYRERSVSEA